MPDKFACLYLHGFLSSPQSLKAQQLVTYFQANLPNAHLVVPTLPFEPSDAIQVAEDALLELKKKFSKIIIIGSSLGGYYATYLAQKHQLKAALINPAVRPFELFADYLGPHQHFYDGNTYELTMAHVKQLQAFDCPVIKHPELLFLLLQTGDETLDYRLAAEHYRLSQCWLEGGGNHSFESFIERLPMLINFVTSA